MKLFKNIKARKLPIKAVAVLLILAVAAAAAGQHFLGQEAAAVDNWSYDSAQRRDISVILSGSGTVEPNDQYNVTASVKGDILECTFEEGDSVEKGQLLYRIDASDAENSIKKSEISMEKQQLNYNQALENIEDLTVKADKSGVILTKYVSVGDDVQQGGKIADARDSSVMKLKIPFNAADTDRFYTGQQAEVTIDGSFETLTGEVTEINGAESVLDGYQIVKYVTIEIKNPGGLSPSTFASASIDGAACNQGANLTYREEFTITAKTSGTVKALYITEGGRVEAGGTVAVLSSTSLQDQAASNALSIKDAQLSLQSLYDQLDNYTITAPISGTIVTKSAKVGDTLDNTNGQNTMAVIYDLSRLTFDMTIDELDIGKVAVGQQVSITADAIENVTFSGHVDKVSVSGTSQNGVTSYPVTIVIDSPPEALLPGMNVNADIVVESAENVLSIPVSAVGRGNTVYVESSSQTAQSSQGSERQNNNGETSGAQSGQANAGRSKSGGAAAANAPEGYTAVAVTLGVNDDNYIEVLSGLSEGDKIAYAVVKSEKQAAAAQGFTMGGGGMPGGGGGMPGGGMPGGGMGGRP